MSLFNVYDFTNKGEITLEIENRYEGKFADAFDKFHQFYTPVLVAHDPDKKPKMPPQSIRQCRFCLEGYPEVRFRKKAHVIPQLLGNKNLVHDSECDQCNRKLADYEDSLSKYIDIMRSADRISGQEGIPNYRSADGKLTARWKTDETGTLIFDIEGEQETDRVGEDSILLQPVKQPYRPLYVMKSLYKIGYSLLHPIELADYTPTRLILNETKYDHLLGFVASIAKYTLPIVQQRPFVVMYQKKEDYCNEIIPTKVVMLHFGRFVYEFFLPHADDILLFSKAGHFQRHFMPPYFEGDTKDITAEIIQLSSLDKKTGEVHSVVMTFDPM